MLFNSYDFALLFLPLVLGGFAGFARFAGTRSAAAWLAAASLFFYAYWAPRFLLLLGLSIVVNFGFGVAIVRRREPAPASAKRLLALAIAVNLAALAWFKYADFLASSLDAFGARIPLPHVLLPIGISFFTFTQIAFLVDARRGIVRETRFVHYVLFVTYFPHLIAGPVLHHADMMPQFALPETYRPKLDNLARGMLFFAAGLAKKVVLADSFADFASPIFDAVDHGLQPVPLAAWSGALGYTFQIYFDFSGYSDMAVGLSKMFGIDIPLNFASPYRSSSIVEFWRRWHMTLSKFLRDYLYVPLGGNRLGELRRNANLMATMLLGGLWHGASWTFVAWGGLHGAYLALAHVWQSRLDALGFPAASASPLRRGAGWLLTAVAVVAAWVFFRATSFDGAGRMLRSMFDLGGLRNAADAWPPFEQVFHGLRVPPDGWTVWLGLLGIGTAIATAMPNLQTIVAGPRAARWLSGTRAAAVLGFLLAATGLLLAVNASRGASEFIYFNF